MPGVVEYAWHFYVVNFENYDDTNFHVP